MITSFVSVDSFLTEFEFELTNYVIIVWQKRNMPLSHSNGSCPRLVIFLCLTISCTPTHTLTSPKHAFSMQAYIRYVCCICYVGSWKYMFDTFRWTLPASRTHDWICASLDFHKSTFYACWSHQTLCKYSYLFKLWPFNCRFLHAPHPCANEELNMFLVL